MFASPSSFYTHHRAWPQHNHTHHREHRACDGFARRHARQAAARRSSGAVAAGGATRRSTRRPSRTTTPRPPTSLARRPDRRTAVTPAAATTTAATATAAEAQAAETAPTPKALGGAMGAARPGSMAALVAFTAATACRMAWRPNRRFPSRLACPHADGSIGAPCLQPCSARLHHLENEVPTETSVWRMVSSEARGTMGLLQH